MDDWTSVSDIGKSFGGEVLSAEKYLRVEQAYVDVVFAIYSEAGTPILHARDVSVVDLATSLPGTCARRRRRNLRQSRFRTFRR
jgi:hypothetical protein